MIEVEYTDEFEVWWETLTESEQVEIDAVVRLLEKLGTQLGYPYSSGIEGDKNSKLRELRVQHKGEPYRVFYAFDPRRIAILLNGGKKTGKNQKIWYKKQTSLANTLYKEHLLSLQREGELL